MQSSIHYILHIPSGCLNKMYPLGMLTEPRIFLFDLNHAADKALIGIRNTNDLFSLLFPSVKFRLRVTVGLALFMVKSRYDSS